MRMLYREVVMTKREAVKQTFDQTLEQNVARLVNHEFIKQMFDEGCFKIEQIQSHASDRIIFRISTLVEKPQ